MLVVEKLCIFTASGPNAYDNIASYGLPMFRELVMTFLSESRQLERDGLIMSCILYNNIVLITSLSFKLFGT